MTKQLVILVALFLGFCAHGQHLDIVPRLGGYYPLKSGKSLPSGGIGGGMSCRYSVTPEVYIQTGYSYHSVHYQDPRIIKSNVQMSDFQLGLIPSSELPIHLYGGVLKHYYNLKYDALVIGGVIYYPITSRQIFFNGWNFGLGYSVKDWLEIKLTYETEPIYIDGRRPNYNYYQNHASKFLRLEVNGVIPLLKWGKAKNSVVTEK
jgi:hypothetical protein